MKFYYGTNDSLFMGRKESISVEGLVEIIKKDVEDGKWNVYDGGRVNSVTATCRWSERARVTNDRLFIEGSRNEIQSLEKQLDGVLTVIPREYTED